MFWFTSSGEEELYRRNAADRWSWKHFKTRVAQADVGTSGRQVSEPKVGFRTSQRFLKYLYFVLALLCVVTSALVYGRVPSRIRNSWTRRDSNSPTVSILFSTILQYFVLSQTRNNLDFFVPWPMVCLFRCRSSKKTHDLVANHLVTLHSAWSFASSSRMLWQKYPGTTFETPNNSQQSTIQESHLCNAKW